MVVCSVLKQSAFALVLPSIPEEELSLYMCMCIIINISGRLYSFLSGCSIDD